MVWLLVLLGLGCSGPAPVAPRVEVKPPVIAREQLFFVGQDDHGPVLAALVLQREPRGAGAVVELKGFVVAGGALRAPFYERAELAAWPGDGVSQVLGAWKQERSGEPVRVGWEDLGDALVVGLRSPAGSLQLTLGGLRPAGSGGGPHGPLSWRAGVGSLVLDGAQIRGVGVVERLRGDTATPAFGEFEMWLLAPGGGGLVLGRQAAGQAGTALRVDRLGGAELGGFEAAVAERRGWEGWPLPTAWRVGGRSLTRVGEPQPVLGRAAGGGEAVYDIGLARGEAGVGLVFHLADGVGPKRAP